MLSRDRMAEPPSADSVGIALDSKQGSAQGRLFIVRRCEVTPQVWHPDVMRAFSKAGLLCLQLTPTGHTLCHCRQSSRNGVVRVEGRPGTVTAMKWKLFKGLS